LTHAPLLDLIFVQHERAADAAAILLAGLHRSRRSNRLLFVQMPFVACLFHGQVALCRWRVGVWPVVRMAATALPVAGR
jgi:hypothetical protein